MASDYLDLEVPASLQLPFADYDSVSNDDEVGVALVQMLNLHPNLVRFRKMDDLGALSTETKRHLLEHMTRALGRHECWQC
jgi:hypothetical protein